MSFTTFMTNGGNKLYIRWLGNTTLNIHHSRSRISENAEQLRKRIIVARHVLYKNNIIKQQTLTPSGVSRLRYYFRVTCHIFVCHDSVCVPYPQNVRALYGLTGVILSRCMTPFELLHQTSVYYTNDVPFGVMRLYPQSLLERFTFHTLLHQYTKIFKKSVYK